MPGAIRVVGTFAVREGNASAVGELAKTIHAVMREKDPGTLAHDWYLARSGQELIVHEHYASAEAAMTHMGNVSEYLSRIFELVDLVSVAFCGDLPPEMEEAVAAFQPKLYKPLAVYSQD